MNPDCLAKYKTFMSEFADVNKVLSRMRNLQHIATAKDMFCENNTTYVILEYVEGVTLKKFFTVKYRLSHMGTGQKAFCAIVYNIEHYT